MTVHDWAELIWQFQLSKPQRRFVSTEIGVGKLDIEQPVVAISRLNARFEHQELLRRLLAKQAVLQAELIVRNLDLLDLCQIDCIKVTAKRFLLVVPKDDAMLMEQPFQCILDSRFWMGDFALSLLLLRSGRR